MFEGIMFIEDSSMKGSKFGSKEDNTVRVSSEIFDCLVDPDTFDSVCNSLRLFDNKHNDGNPELPKA